VAATRGPDPGESTSAGAEVALSNGALVVTCEDGSTLEVCLMPRPELCMDRAAARCMHVKETNP
jgi:hypothetical protein